VGLGRLIWRALYMPSPDGWDQVRVGSRKFGINPSGIRLKSWHDLEVEFSIFPFKQEKFVQSHLQNWMIDPCYGKRGAMLL
ncbi:MAG: hypothetical protein ABJZ69_17165, partial [Hyphomicrobiales bacterium]